MAFEQEQAGPGPERAGPPPARSYKEAMHAEQQKRAAATAVKAQRLKEASGRQRRGAMGWL